MMVGEWRVGGGCGMLVDGGLVENVVMVGGGDGKGERYNLVLWVW